MHACQLWILRLPSILAFILAANRPLPAVQTGRILEDMATPVLIPVSEYLKTRFRPDCDYIDGEVKVRHLGETPHGTAQSVIAAIFLANRKSWQVRAITEQRIQTSLSHFRVADVCVLRFGEPPGPIVHTPPLVCVEVLSPEQSLADVQEVVNDYVNMGVENIWILDPAQRIAWIATAKGFELLSSEEFSVAGTGIRIALADIYEQLDEMAAGR
jgi:Uma2 family endonuclease